MEVECDASYSQQQPRRSRDMMAATNEMKRTIGGTKKRLTSHIEKVASFSVTVGHRDAAASDHQTNQVGSCRPKSEPQLNKKMSELRAHLTDQRKFAARLVNLMNRQPYGRTIQTLNRYEQAALARTKAAANDFDQVFTEAQTMLASADLSDHCSTSLRMLENTSGQRRLTVEAGMVLKPPHEITSTIAAIWSFRQHRYLRNHFVYDHIDTGCGDTVGFMCRFQPRHGPFASTHFRGDYLQRRSMIENGIAILIKLHSQSTEPDPSRRIHMRGTGYNVIQRVETNDGPEIIVRTAVGLPLDNSVEGVSLSRRDPRSQILMKYMNLAFEAYADFARQRFMNPTESV